MSDDDFGTTIFLAGIFVIGFLVGVFAMLISFNEIAKGICENQGYSLKEVGFDKIYCKEKSAEIETPLIDGVVVVVEEGPR